MEVSVKEEKIQVKSHNERHAMYLAVKKKIYIYICISIYNFEYIQHLNAHKTITYKSVAIESNFTLTQFKPRLIVLKFNQAKEPYLLNHTFEYI